MTTGAGVLVKSLDVAILVIKIWRQSERDLIMSKEDSTKVIIFMTPRTGILVIMLGHIGHIVYIVKVHYLLMKNNVLLCNKKQVNCVYNYKYL